MSIKRATRIVLVASTVMLAVGAVPGSAARIQPSDLSPASVGAGGSPLGSSFAIRDDPSVAEVQPAVAYNPDRQEYLVVFYNDRPGYDDIRAERVSKDGKLLGGVWVAAGVGPERYDPDVAYNSQAQEYLVVWAAEDTGGNTYIQGQRLRGTDAHLQGSAIPIHTAPPAVGWVSTPAVAYASAVDDYLVVWRYSESMPFRDHVVGRIVSSSGTPSPAGFFFISQDPGGLPRDRPDLAYNRHGNGFLVVWQQRDSTASWDIYGQLVNGDGYIPPSFLPIKVADEAVHCAAPAVAAIPTAPGPYKYLVVYKFEFSPGDWAIYGRLTEETGMLCPHPLGSVELAVDQSSPAVAGTESGHRYLVTWRSSPGGGGSRIHGWTIPHEGTPLGWMIAEFPGVAAEYPAVAAGSTGDFLVAWQDQPMGATNTNIYGQLWGNRVYLPLVLRAFP
jgi:hypothetical protein